MAVKVVVTDYIEADLEWEAQELARRGIDFECHQLKFAPEEAVVDATKDADIVVVNMVKLPASVIEKWDKCRLVIRHGAGYDNVDVPALTQKKIVLEYIPDYCSDEVAEHAIAMLFACARKIVWSRRPFDESVQRGEWDLRDVIPMHRLTGSTIGIVGCGRIGSLVREKLSAFGVRFLRCDPYLPEAQQEAIGAELVDLETLCKESDYITLHMSLTPETRHIINAETLSLMKPTAYLINTSRGGLVDTDALAVALKNKTIAGAAIDVFEREPPAPDSPLLALDNAILTPHLSWYSKEAEQEIREKIILTIDMFVNNKGPRFPVNPEALND